MSSNNYNNHFTFDFVHSGDAESIVSPSSPPRRHLPHPPESKCSSFHLLSLRRRTWDNRPQFGYWKQDQHPATVDFGFLSVSCAYKWRPLYLQAADRSRDFGFTLVLQHFRCRRPPFWKKEAKTVMQFLCLLIVSQWLFCFYITLWPATTAMPLILHWLAIRKKILNKS